MSEKIKISYDPAFIKLTDGTELITFIANLKLEDDVDVFDLAPVQLMKAVTLFFPIDFEYDPEDDTFMFEHWCAGKKNRVFKLPVASITIIDEPDDWLYRNYLGYLEECKFTPEMVAEVFNEFSKGFKEQDADVIKDESNDNKPTRILH